jgi:hypothetical protein
VVTLPLNQSQNTTAGRGFNGSRLPSPANRSEKTRLGAAARSLGARNDDASAGMGVLGLGVDWNFHPRWSLRLQAQHHFALEDEQVALAERRDVSLFTAGIGYRF